MNYSFAAERTLGKLAKWLRLLGFDTIFELDVCDGRFMNDFEPERILLTRTEQIREACSSRRLIFVESNDLKEQLRQVIHELGIALENTRPLTRCLKCNVIITTIEKGSICGQVPDHVWETNDIFQTCSKCKRIYWPGSHTKRSMERIEEFFR